MSNTPEDIAQVLGRPRGDLPARNVAGLRTAITPGWKGEAACREVGSEMFFLEHGESIDPSVAQVCARYPVRRSCLASALLINEHGIWAGTTLQERRHGGYRLRYSLDAESVLDQMLGRAAARNPNHHDLDDHDTTVANPGEAAA